MLAQAVTQLIVGEAKPARGGALVLPVRLQRPTQQHYLMPRQFGAQIEGLRR